ncbi:MAG TPA: folylpolyglutamate synthase/dihydrofolate synthase family protein, partial [Bacillaceae bacterium]
MLKSYDEALEWIHARLRLGIKPGLKRMEWMLERLGHPENKLNVIHVGGTNGKGSTVSYIRSILNEAGYRTGTFTSPYIKQFNERISVDGVPIPDESITNLANIIKPLADELEHTELGAPTEFEVITAMAIYYFAELDPVEWTVVEVGLGGRFDSTNVVAPAISVITNIGMDHTQILGDTVGKIAFEKAGIIKEQTPVVTAAKQKEALNVFHESARSKNAHIFVLGKDFGISSHKSTESGEEFDLTIGTLHFSRLSTSLMGRHQTENAALAVMALHILADSGKVVISEPAIREGLFKAYWP